MSKNITSVVWEASDLPTGITFDTDTGIFSGTPSEAGEYSVPVKVTTNYGSDEKDVSIVVEGEAYPVYAIGQMAETWSEGAEADSNGFRKLNMPNAYRLRSQGLGFGAKCEDGDYYTCGYNNVRSTQTYSSGIDKVSKPTIVSRVDSAKVEDMIFGKFYADYSPGNSQRDASDSAWFAFKAYRDSSNQLFVTCVVTQSYQENTTRDSSGKVTYTWNHDANIGSPVGTSFNIFKLPDNDGYTALGCYLVTDKNSLYFRRLNDYSWSNPSTSTTDYDIKKYFVIGSTNGYSMGRALLSNDGRLFSSSTQVDFPYGVIKDVWIMGNMTNDAWFALNENNELYARGGNSNNQLGLEGTTFRSDWEKVGEFDVKKIKSTTYNSFLLTNDGKLYFTGKELTALNLEASETFTRIFPNYYFQDIAFDGSTLVVTMEE